MKKIILGSILAMCSLIANDSINDFKVKPVCSNKVNYDVLIPFWSIYSDANENLNHLHMKDNFPKSDKMEEIAKLTAELKFHICSENILSIADKVLDERKKDLANKDLYDYIYLSLTDRARINGDYKLYSDLALKYAATTSVSFVMIDLFTIEYEELLKKIKGA